MRNDNNYSISTMTKRALKKGDFFNKVICYLIIKAGFSNRELSILQLRNKSFNKLKKKYANKVKKYDYEAGKKSNYVWICWFQGVENAPDLVKKCIASIRKNMPNKDVIIITSENMCKYVEFPDNILKKWNDGIISNAHMSDILRTLLLIKYGGYWVDATVYMTGLFPKFIEDSDFFAYHSENFDDKTITCNSWFLYSKTDNNILKTIRDLLFIYWKKENKLKEYFLWHLFATMAIKMYPDEWKKTIFISDTLPHTLSKIIFDEYNEEYWNLLNNQTHVHKLSYKLDFSKNTKGSYYEEIFM